MKILALALIIDAIIGDNLGRFHPVVLIGNLIGFLEKKLYRSPEKRANNKLAGVILIVIVTTASFSATFGLLKLVEANKLLFTITSAFLISTTFAFRGLLASGLLIYKALKNDDLPLARKLLAKIVGRDTDKLNRPQIVKATIESLAENTVDGIIAPLFYALLGGPAVAFVYRSINTLDSMVGYKNERYKDFGWASAKLDDIVNFIPARIGLVFIWLASLLCGLNFKETIKTSIKDGSKHLSPNSGLSEAAFAGALEVQLGGVAYYQGIAREMPVFGTGTISADLNHIRSSLLLITVTVISFLITMVWLSN